MPTLTDWVAAFAQALSKRIGEKRYHLWFEQQTRLTWTDQELVVGVPNRFFLDWLQGTFAEAIQAAAESVAGQPVPVRFVIDPALFQAHRQHRLGVAVRNETSGEKWEPPGVCADAAEVSLEPGPAVRQARPAPNKLDRFLVGESNRLAYAAVKQLVESLRQDTSWFGGRPRPAGIPLTLYGPHGVGKTHLLEGCAQALEQASEPGKIVCLTAEDFTNQFLQAMRQGKLSEFRRRFRSLTALLLDDLQFLEGKRATQEELVHTLEALTRHGRVFVATCDRHPRQARWSPELVDRLLGGAVWAVELPDVELRRRLYQAKAQELGLVLGSEVTDYLAQSVRGNVRELEGALYAIYHYATVHRQPITLPLAQQALGHWLRPNPGAVGLRDVERAVSRVLHLRPGVLRGRDKVRSASHPRMLAMYLARKHTGLPYSEIGRYFGGRNHSTVIAAERKVAGWLRDHAHLRLGGQNWAVADLLEHIEREL
ncbi:Chromosomal replication initiator protein DnaA [bacterium HR36]|nr:Chromosomal replication initiator protein DnaA [bacterium HR36]